MAVGLSIVPLWLTLIVWPPASPSKPNSIAFPFTEPVIFASPKIWLWNVPVSFSLSCWKTTVGLPEPWFVSTVTCHVPETSAAKAKGIQSISVQISLSMVPPTITVSESEARHLGRSLYAARLVGTVTGLGERHFATHPLLLQVRQTRF